MEISVREISNDGPRGRMFNILIENGENGERSPVSIDLAERELLNLQKAISLHYCREDVLDRFCGEGSEYDAEALLKDEALISEMTDFYADRRSDHSTGGCMEDVAHWTVSMRETEDEFADRLSRYPKK